MSNNNDDEIRVLVVDDHPMMRRGVVQLLGMDKTINPVGEAVSGEEAIKKAVELDPDLILLDLNMDGMNGIDTLIALRNAEIYAKVLVFTVSDSEEDVLAALKAGADGYVFKDIEPEELIDCIKQAIHGKSVLSDKLVGILASALRNKPVVKTAATPTLTDREIEILKQIREGNSNKIVARNLEITEGTVKVHVKNILKKLGLKSRVEAAVWAVEHPEMV